MNNEELKYKLIQDIIKQAFTREELIKIKTKMLDIKNNGLDADVVEFTEKELNTMPKNIKKLLLLEKKRCRLRTKASGKNSITYEIRYRKDGYNISACGKTIELAKENFISKCKVAQPIKANKTAAQTPTTFNTFALYYFNNFRVLKVAESTYKNDLKRYNKHIKPFFEEKELSKITPNDCQTLLNTLTAAGKGKTADEIFSLLNAIFKTAVKHSLINHNPLDVVFHTQHERAHGKALTTEQEQILFNGVKSDKLKTAFALMLYCGLRPNEIKTAAQDDLFIIAVNSKRKNKKVELKKIPIIDKLKPYLPITAELQSITEQQLQKTFKRLLPYNKPYDLRTTFYTRCDELGVSTPARDEFVGHSAGALTNAYRDLSNNYLLKESEKLNKWK